MAWMMTINVTHLGDAAVLIQPLWIAVTAIPVVWFLLPNKLHCTMCNGDSMIPISSVRGRQLTDGAATKRAG